jgi:hypothetical protein
VTSTAAPPRSLGRPDRICAAAVDLAREAILDDHVGGHLGVITEGDRLVTHLFACTLPGYRGWRWSVTVTRVPRSRHVTVSETVLLPGDAALLAPDWVPWQERLQPGDLGVGDLLPTRADDDRLVPGYLLSDDPAVDEVSWELGLGRSRVMSREGRADTAQRWYDGDHGPGAAISVAAPPSARCGTCGFYLPLAGSLRRVFGACGNMFAPDDGRVVSADHGCGAHSEVLIETVAPVEELPTVFDDSEVEQVAVVDVGDVKPVDVVDDSQPPRDEDRVRTVDLPVLRTALLDQATAESFGAETEASTVDNLPADEAGQES